MSETEQIVAEQAHVDRAYACLDAELLHARERLPEALARPAGDATGLVERDSEVHRLTGRITVLQNAEKGLCFGRIDREDGERLHIGRTGISDGDRHLVIDWRAPAAAPFYAATARDPLGVVRRRHLTIAQRRVTRIDDDVLDPDGAGDDVVGDGALLRALNASRDGRMRDAVATLQAEQDSIVRAPLPGVLVVQGAPGTGKTVVALHRAAYLLYRSPELLRRGVLIVGPNDRFLDYIGDVLPALGETNVVTSTVEALFPGQRDLPSAAPEVARLLGDARMAQVLASFVASLQGAGAADGHHVTWEGEDIHIPWAVIDRCADAARKTRELHNVARQTFQTELLDELTTLVAQADAARFHEIERGLDEQLSRHDAWLARNADALMPRRPEEELADQERLARRELREELGRDAAIQREIDSLWPALCPEDAVRRLLCEGLTTEHAPHLSEQESRLLAGTAQAPWTTAHVPLFDEAADLLGADHFAESPEAARRRGRELAFARRVLETEPSLAEWMTAEMLAERNAVADHRDLADRALADRAWAYGHVIVDEAQDLSPMQWRMIARRCPSRSMTIVGDIAQSSRADDAPTWAERLGELRATPRLVELTICYRSPRELVDAVEPLLREIRPGAAAINAVRSTGRLPEVVEATVDDVEEVVRWARQERGSGQHAIITPDPERVIRALARHDIAVRADDLRAPLVTLPPTGVKGLEFDHVLVHAPEKIAATWGPSTLYVALTRSTATLTVVQDGATADLFRPPLWRRRDPAR